VTRPRVLVIGLDGLEIESAERLVAAGEMPALAELRRQAVRFRLVHGPAQRTGLAWKRVASRLSPEAARRWGAVGFDPTTYTVWQEGARFTPSWAALDRRVVVFDTPYVGLRRAPHTRGIVGWGAHDAGTLTADAPAELWAEFEQRFGPYPPSKWLYGTPSLVLSLPGRRFVYDVRAGRAVGKQKQVRIQLDPYEPPDPQSVVCGDADGRHFWATPPPPG
jgi:hypothetical protein